jgi:hypothetical protein
MTRAVLIQLLVLYNHYGWQVKVSGMVWCSWFDQSTLHGVAINQCMVFMLAQQLRWHLIY